MNKLIKILLSIPKTLFVNFRYLSLRQALKLPMIVAYNAHFVAHRGRIQLPERVSFGMIHIGFFGITICSHDKTIVRVEGTLVFKGRAHFGRSSKVYVRKGAKMVLGDNFKISSASSFDCMKKIDIGDDVLFAWDCLVLDYDGHAIYCEDGDRINEDKPIIIGNYVWVGCRSTILKGTVIPDNCVVGAGTLLSGQKLEANSIVVGNPPKSRKKISGWKL